MSLFQKSVEKKYLSELNEAIINSKYTAFQEYFGNTERQENIRNSKEEQFQEGFLRELFVNIFDYTLNPEPGFNLTTELKNVSNRGKVDGAVLNADGEAIAVIELKSAITTDLDSIETQAFGYKNHQPKCVYVITSNFEKLRFYIEDAIDFIDFNLFALSKEQFALLWLCLAKDSLLNNRPLDIKKSSIVREEDITKKLYTDYSAFRKAVFNNLVEKNTDKDKLLVFKKTQKLLDRFLFIFFAEDRLLLPPNSINRIIGQWKSLKDLDEYKPLYSRFIKYFGYMDRGFKGKDYDIFAYNGGLFKPDEVLDNILIDDDILLEHTQKLSQYNFDTDVDVNILGHIFEHSLGEIESIHAEINGQELDSNKSKRKKDGIFYTPKYITQYIVENTIGRLCKEKRVELGLVDEEYAGGRRSRKKTTIIALDKKLSAYKDWLLGLTILDPACGSGAFLNQALDFLIGEHWKINVLDSQLHEENLGLHDIETDILERNIYGVDINEESVEIAKLSLWLRTAQKGRKLNTLNNNIKCGNSLVDDPEVAGDKAFNWQEEFPDVFVGGGFDVVIGNPPYVRSETLIDEHKTYFSSEWYSPYKQYDLYVIFYELGIKLLKAKGLLGFITPNKFYIADYGKKCREYILNNSLIIEIADVSMMNVFQGASIYPTIVTLMKDSNLNHIVKVKPNLNNKNELNINKYETIKQMEYLNSEDYIINLNIINRELLLKIEKEGTVIKDLFKITRGFRPPKEDLISTTNIDGAFPLIVGKALNRAYNLNWDGKFVVYKRTEIPESKPIDVFTQPKIFIRDIGLKFNAYIDNKNFLCLKTVYFIYGASEEILKHVTALLNSKLLNFYFSEKYSAMHISGGYLRFRKQFIENVPVKIIENKTPFIEKVDKMLNLNSTFQKRKNKFTNRVITLIKKTTGKDEVKLSKNMDLFYLMDFSTFVLELKKKNKVTLKLKEQDEWEEYFEDYSKELKKVKAEIEKTDNEIDQLVYELYGLSDDEIDIVEGSGE